MRSTVTPTLKWWSKGLYRARTFCAVPAPRLRSTVCGPAPRSVTPLCSQIVYDVSYTPARSRTMPPAGVEPMGTPLARGSASMAAWMAAVSSMPSLGNAPKLAGSRPKSPAAGSSVSGPPPGNSTWSRPISPAAAAAPSVSKTSSACSATRYAPLSPASHDPPGGANLYRATRVGPSTVSSALMNTARRSTPSGPVMRMSRSSRLERRTAASASR